MLTRFSGEVVMKKIEKVDDRYLEFEGYDDLLVGYKTRQQGEEENCEIKYYKVSESYEDMGF